MPCLSRHLRTPILVLLTAAMFACSHAGSDGGGLSMGGVLPGAGAIHPQMTTLRDQTFAHVVRQRTDFSCGAAALATILKYAYNMDIDERQVFFGMYAVSDQAQVRQRGFSLLDMKAYLKTIGMQGVGFKVTTEALYQVKVPVIVLLNMNGYEHFVVMRKATPDGVYVADPALGNREMPNDLFFKDWQYSVIFAVIGPKYDPENVLVLWQRELNVNQQVRNLMPAFNPLNEATLQTITIIPGLNIGNK